MTYKIVMKNSDLVMMDLLTLSDARCELKYYGNNFEIRNEKGKVIEGNGCKVHRRTEAGNSKLYEGQAHNQGCCYKGKG